MTSPEKSVEQLLDECMSFDLRRTTRRVSQLYDHMISPSGITSPQWSLLRVLQKGNLSIARLSAMLDVDRTSLRRMLDPLERDRLISIAADPLDKRSRIVGLTPKGRIAFKSAHEHWQKAQHTLFDLMGESNWRKLVSTLRTTNKLLQSSTNTSP